MPKFTEFLKPVTSLFQPTTSEGKPDGDNKAHNNKIYCEYGVVEIPNKHEVVESFIKEVEDRKKAIAKKSLDQFPELEEALMWQFKHYMHNNFKYSLTRDEHLLREMVKVGLASGLQSEDLVNNGQAYRNDDSLNIDSLAAKLNLRGQKIIEEHFGAKDAESLKDISLGGALLRHVLTKCLREVNSKEHNVHDTEISNGIAAQNLPPVQSNNKTALVP